MKTKIKRHSRSVVSVVLAVCLLVSCLTVGIIATNAAYIGGNPKTAENMKANTADVANSADKTENEAVGAKAPEAVGAKVDSESVGATYYLLCSYNSNKPTDMTHNVSSSSATFTVTPSSFGKSSWETGKNYYVAISSSTSYTNMYSQGGSSAKGTVTGPLTAGTQSYNYGEPSVTYNFAYFCVTNTAIGNVTVSVSGGDNTTYNFSATNPSYNISYNTPTNGSFTTKPTTANAGSTVTVVATPSTGYQLATFTVTNSSTSATITTSGSGNTKTFTMPSANVSISVTFTLASYDVTASTTGCTITELSSPYTYGSTVTFRLTPNENYALKSLTVKQGSSNVSTTKTDGEGYSDYSFTMPAGAVAITAVCATTVGTATVYFKSATAYVYHPIISINGGAEQEMTLKLSGETDSNIIYLNPTKVNAPRSETGSLRYAWYKATLTGVDTTKPVSFMIRGTDTYMEATGSFTISSGDSIWLACDNLMEGSELVNVTDDENKDFYDTPLNMIDD